MSLESPMAMMRPFLTATALTWRGPLSENVSTRPLRRMALAVAMCPQNRIQQSADGIAEHIESQHCRRNAQSGKESSPPGCRILGLRHVQHLAPAHHVRIAEAQEAQTSF